MDFSGCGRPELKNLGWFVGTWQFDLDAKESPLGPKGKQSLTTNCRWFASGQHVICTNAGTTPAGPYHEDVAHLRAVQLGVVERGDVHALLRDDDRARSYPQSL